mgnify:CR=1 FL=1
MKAVQIANYGGVEAIEFNSEAKKPTLKAGQILVEVHAASLNRIDSAFRKGYLKKMMPVQMPLTLGGDFAGVVTELGDGVSKFKVGDEVYGNAGTFKGGSGALAEFVSANSANTAHKPKSLDFSQAAALPLAGASALQGVFEELNVQSGQKILIQGGAGGVGSLAIQIAKLKGAYVATTVAGSEIDFAKNLGADEVLDYKTQDVTKALKDYDGVFDTAGGEGLNKLFSILKKDGKLVSMAGQPDQELAKQHEVTAISQMTTVSTEQLKELAELVDSGKVKVQIEKTLPFVETKTAFEYFETQHPKGKIVVVVK